MRSCSWWFCTALSAIVTMGCGKSDAPSSPPPKTENTPVVESAKADKTATMDFASNPDNNKEAQPAADAQPAAKAPSAASENTAAPSDTAPNTEEAGAAIAALGSVSADGTSVSPLETPFLLKREGLQIEKLTLSRGFEKAEDGSRVPLEPGYTFPCDDRRVYVILDLVNPNEETAGDLKVGWIKPGSEKEGNAVTLSVTPKKTWRTFAFNGFVNKAPGKWQVVIRDAEDTILARASFEMQSNQP